MALDSSSLLQTLGRLHVVTVHLPIALLLVAGLIEMWRAIWRKQGASPTTITCVAIGAISAVVVAAIGLVHQSFVQMEHVMVHQVLGIATAVSALTALVLIKSRFARPAVIVSAILVSVAGHFGGELTHGDRYLTELIFPNEKNDAVTEVTAPTTKVTTGERIVTVDYDRDVHPLLAAACYECHSDKVHKGGLRLYTPGDILAGGSSGPVVIAGKSADSLLIKRVMGLGGKKRMPVDHPALSDSQIAILRTWIDEGATVAGKKVVAKTRWDAPLAPVHVEIPGPVDYLLEKYFAQHKIKPAAVVEDRVYARRVYLDVIGMLPTAAELHEFLNDSQPDKRGRLVRKLLDDKRRYAEQWLTFWNDALRNDYSGPGYIDGGRKQITQWLYQALLDNKPYDKFVTELICPVAGSEGFTKGIIWRGAVSASQRPELQAAQNISQVFMGINMKCNSCHDSFVSEWKLSDAYGLAGVYSDKPLEMFRCEKPMGKIAPVKFMYPKIGTIDGNAPPEQRKAQLAKLITSKENGRLARTIVNRLWARLMGRGLVEPVDEMDNEPWNSQLLDWLATDLVDHGYDLKHTIEVILTSRAYQLPSVGMKDPNEKDFVFAGPVVKRMSAEQFSDAVSELTGVWHVSSAADVWGKKPAEKDFRAVWAKNDALMSALGRPNREQVMTDRTTAATTLQMLELTNGVTLANILNAGAKKWIDQPQMIDEMYEAALGRKPTSQEMQAATELVGTPAKAEGVQDLLWSILMLPEFQLVY